MIAYSLYSTLVDFPGFDNLKPLINPRPRLSGRSQLESEYIPNGESYYGIYSRDIVASNIPSWGLL